MSITDKILLRKRALIETVSNELKNIAQIEHSRHRSFNNFIAIHFRSLPPIASLKKPAIYQYTLRKTFHKKVIFIISVIKHFDGLHDKAECYPYVGYEHKVLPGENLSTDMTEEEVDRLLRSDLMKLCKMFSGYGQDSLLLATPAYNVGAYRLLGYGNRPKSRLVQMLDEGDRNIYREYITLQVQGTSYPVFGTSPKNGI